MTVRKRKKTRKHRGSRSHGYGRTGQHRRSAHKAGRGNVGYRDHKWSYTVKYEPQRFKRRGFKPPINTTPQFEEINLQELDERTPQLLAQGRALKKDETVYIDLIELGYSKLLGKGRVTRPLSIRVNNFTVRAREKIEEAGGEIISRSNEQRK